MAKVFTMPEGRKVFTAYVYKPKISTNAKMAKVFTMSEGARHPPMPEGPKYLQMPEGRKVFTAYVYRPL